MTHILNMVKATQIPKFNGMNNNPKKILDSIKKYIDAISPNFHVSEDWSVVKRVLCNCQVDSTNFWYEAIVDNSKS